MATAFTHAFVGAALAGSGPHGLEGRAARAVVATAAALAVLPDADVVAFSLGIPYGHPFGHRGFTHSLLFAVLCGGLCAAVLVRCGAVPARRGRAVALALIAATASHGVLDALTDGGLGVGFFVPFSNARLFFPWRPLVVSPLGVAAFLHGRAPGILASELLWVWCPTGVLAALALGLRQRAARAAP